MSIEVMRYVWKHSKSKSNARLMLLAIADIANDNGDAYPGVDKLGDKCNISHRCAQDVIQDLERINELQVFENVGTKTISGWTNLYRIILKGVEQGIVRNPTGTPAIARTPSIKKSRSFPKGVQTVAPLKDVQTVAPDEVQPDSPHEVQTVAPKALGYSPEDSSGLNTDTPQTPNSNSSENANANSSDPQGLKAFYKRLENQHKLLPASVNGKSQPAAPVATPPNPLVPPAPLTPTVATNVTDEVSKQWKLAHDMLRLQIDRSTFSAWLENIQLTAVAEDMWFFTAKTDEQVKRLYGLAREIKRVLRDVTGLTEIEVQFSLPIAEVKAA